MRDGADPDDVRLTELVAAISLATDLSTRQPLEHALRTCLLSAAVAGELGLDTASAVDVHYVALLRFLGCVADAPEMGDLAGGDGAAFIAAMAPVYMGSSGGRSPGWQERDTPTTSRGLSHDVPTSGYDDSWGLDRSVRTAGTRHSSSTVVPESSVWIRKVSTRACMVVMPYPR
jgi:hypothetical protein